MDQCTGGGTEEKSPRRDMEEEMPEEKNFVEGEAPEEKMEEQSAVKSGERLLNLGPDEDNG